MQPSQSPSAALPRILGPWMAFFVVVGTVIGSGIFKKPAAVARDISEPGLALFAWVLVGLITLMGSLALAEVAILFPRAGGNYVFLREGYGRWAGFLWGWVEFWIIRCASIGALASIFTDSLHDILRYQLGSGDGDVLGFWTRLSITAAVIAALSAVNGRGAVLGASLQSIVATVKMASLIGIAITPIVILGLALETPTVPEASRLTPVVPADWSGVNWSKFGAALLGIFWAYHGWMNLAPIAEEVKDPSRNIPLALLLGVLAVIGMYVSVNVSYFSILDQETLRSVTTSTVAGEFFVRVAGPIGAMIASLAIMISVFGALNGNILVGPRLLYAMGRDGLAPSALGNLHSRFQTPVLAQVVLAAWSILLVLLSGCIIHFGLPKFTVGGWTIDLALPTGANLFDLLTDYAMFGALSFETLAVAAIFVFHWKYPEQVAQLPYRCPFYPVLPALFVAAQFAVLGNMFVTRPTESLFGIGFVVLGGLVYALFLRKGQSPLLM